ncbi:MAG: hypothetical protein B7Y58_07375 [Halothiobacillus sp. 35-54-62]|nr:MAG: hypothetical protein B7Y58_07375 [Halothiobacillus sp. 35-54-62]
MDADIKRRAETGYFIGVMSGTSMDAVDACIVDFSTRPPQVVAHYSAPLDDLRDELRALALGAPVLTHGDAIDYLGQLDIRMARRISECVNTLVQQSGLSRHEMIAVGCHGQTIALPSSRIFGAAIWPQADKVRPWCPWRIRRYLRMPPPQRH